MQKVKNLNLRFHGYMRWKNGNFRSVQRFLVDDSHFVSVTVATKIKSQAVKAAAAFEEAPLCVWVSRGMPIDRPDLSELNKRIVLESWVYLRPNMFRIGQILFCDMFETSPMVTELFMRYHAVNFRGCDDAKMGSEKMRLYAIKNHVDKVMITLDKIITVTEDSERLEYLMHELGDRHAEKNVRIEFLDFFIPSFVQAIRPALTDKWASSIEDAWAAFFKHTLHFMKESIVF